MARGASLDAAAFRRETAAGKIAPVYLLHGEEAFLKEEAVALLRRAVLGEGGAEASPWSLTVLEGGSTRLLEILDAARTIPMLSPRRLVLVKEAEKIRENDAGPLKEYLGDPSPTTCLVFVSGAGKPDFRRAVFRALQERGREVEFPLLKGASVPKWIKERVKERGAEIDPEAAALLEAHAGADLFRIDQEITKVLDFLSPSRSITAEPMGEVLGSAAAGSVFELAEKVGAGEIEEAVRLLRGILAEGEEPTRLLFLIARHIRILILGKSLMRQGHRGRDLAQALGIPPYPFILEKTQKLIARFPESAGAPSVRRILEADRALKGGGGKGPSILERLVLDITALVGRGSGRREATT
jgi:DNA polymerase III subunit delta